MCVVSMRMRVTNSRNRILIDSLRVSGSEIGGVIMACNA
jgi:hypothetical protein